MFLIFFLGLLHEFSVGLLPESVLELEVVTLEVVSLVVFHELIELFLPSFVEVWNLLNDRVWDAGNVEKNDNQVRLFALDS